jgi:hypothetical protein
MAELPPIEIEYLGEQHDGHDFGVRLLFDQKTVYLPLRVTGSDMARHGPEPKDDASKWAKAACVWAERKFHAQYASNLDDDFPVLDQMQIWEKDDLPLYLHFAE